MPLEARMKVFTPLNTAGVSQEKGIAVIYHAMEVKGDRDSNIKFK